MKRTSSFIKCNRCKNQLGYDLMSIGTTCTKAIIYLWCNNCGEKNTLVDKNGVMEDPDQLNLFTGSKNL